MNYIEKIKQYLNKRFDDEDLVVSDNLQDFYALTILLVGNTCTNKDIHNAWAVWQNITIPNNKSIMEFHKLKNDVYLLDLYRKSIDVCIDCANSLRI